MAKNYKRNEDEKYTDREDGKSGGKQYKGKGKKPYNKGRKPEGDQTRYDDIHSNDISWYNKVQPYYGDAVRLPFNRIMGDPVKQLTTKNAGGEYILTPNAPSGVMSIFYVPTMGKAKDANDPVNRSFTSMYGDIYSRTTGAMQFQQADLALWTLGMSSVMQMIGYVRRALGVVNLYASQNFYYPRTLLKAMNIDFDDLLPRQDEVRRRLNNSILSLNSMKVPNFIDLFKRHYSLSTNIWADEDSIQAQLYMFIPNGYYRYDDTASKLTYVNFDWSTVQNIDQWLDAIDIMLNAWRNSSDLGLIKGSVERAYKESALLALDYVALDDITMPVYDKVMTWQINNMDLVGGGIDGLDITQNAVKNVLICEPFLQYETTVLDTMTPFELYKNTSKYLNSSDGDTSDEFIMESTRLMFQVDEDKTRVSGALTIYPLLNFGTEVCIRTVMWSIGMDASDNKIENSVESIGRISIKPTMTDAERVFIANTLVNATKFKNGPRIQVYTANASKHKISPGIVGDLYVYTTIDEEGLYGLNMAALQSIYTVDGTIYLK